MLEKSSGSRRGEARAPQWSGPTFTIQICIPRQVAACCLEHVTLAETGLDSDVVLPWTRALAEQEQAVAMEHGPEREDPTLHSPRTPKADSPPSFLERARGRSLCMHMDRAPAPTVSSATAVQLRFQWWIYTKDGLAGKLSTHSYSKSPQLQLGI